MLKLMTIDGLSSALTARLLQRFLVVRGWQKKEAEVGLKSVGLLRVLRPWKVGVEKSVEAMLGGDIEASLQISMKIDCDTRIKDNDEAYMLGRDLWRKEMDFVRRE